MIYLTFCTGSGFLRRQQVEIDDIIRLLNWQFEAASLATNNPESLEVLDTLFCWLYRLTNPFSLCLLPKVTMTCRRLCIANGHPSAIGPFILRGLSTMSLLTELRIDADLGEDNSLQELTMLQKLAIDYGHEISWLRRKRPAYPIVAPYTAKVTELRIEVQRQVSISSRLKKRRAPVSFKGRDT